MMEIVNETGFPEGLVVGTGPKAQPALAILVKATFAIPTRTRVPAEKANEQLPLAITDEYYDGNVTGSVKLESDMVLFKPRADIVLAGKAQAPGKKPRIMLDVLLRVGRIAKIIRVFGDREWLFPTKLAMIPVISEPQPFTEMPLIYERAFGGIDHKAGKWCKENWIGRGFIGKKSKECVNKKPLPNLEDPKQLINSWDDQPKPVGFGFYGRSSQPRIGYAGTYDDKWLAERAPELAKDFRFDFFNGAHPDLQVPGYLRGDEEVEMRHLTPKGDLLFRLPGIRPVVTVKKFVMPAAASPTSSDVSAEAPVIKELPTREESIPAPLDTLVFLPEEGIFYQVWRGLCPLHELSVEEISSIKVKLAKV